jgi:peptidoglycan/xylan/chitin deacetylase (PgdA/CDA1 family)
VRNLIGYGATPPDPRWPGGARVAVQFVVNYEEGAENSVLNGDKGSEAFLSEMVGAASHPARAMAMESCTGSSPGAPFPSPSSASPMRWR